MLRSGGQFLAALGAARAQYFAAADSCLAGPKTMPPFAHEIARLEGALHHSFPQKLEQKEPRLAGGLKSGHDTSRSPA